VLSRRFIRRSECAGFLTVGIECGAAALIALGVALGRVRVLEASATPQGIAGVWLGVGGGALAFILWVLALERTMPTRVASTMTVNPLAAVLLVSALVGEAVTLNLLLGLVAVFAGIWLGRTGAPAPALRRAS